MNVTDLFFYLFSLISLACALGVVLSRNSVASALNLLGVLVGLTGLFVLLEAFLLAALLVFVYAGAVVTLFLFVVMLTGATGEETNKPRIKKGALAAGVFASLILLAMVFSLALFPFADGAGTVPDSAAAGASLRYYGRELFTTYLLPVQIVGFLLLSALLGVVVIAKRNFAQTK